MRYSFNMYKDMVMDSLQAKLGEEKVRLVTIPKNNGVNLQGVQLNKGINMACPVIYFNSSKECYSDADVEEFVEEAKTLFYYKEAFSTEEVMTIRDWKIARGGLRAKVVNYETNKAYLKDKPFVRFLDLAIMFVVATEGIVPGCEDGAITVNNVMKNFWNVDEAVLYQVAMDNLHQSNYRICGIRSMLGFMDGDEDLADEDLCVATTYDSKGGAAVILSRSILSEACKKMKCESVYILPSSLHEILLIDCKKADLKNLQQMVKDVNESIVDAQDVLADTVYIFEHGVVRVA